MRPGATDVASSVVRVSEYRKRTGIYINLFSLRRDANQNVTRAKHVSRSSVW